MNKFRDLVGKILFVVLICGMLATSLHMLIVPTRRFEFTGEISVYNMHDKRYRIENEATYVKKDGDADGTQMGRSVDRRYIPSGVFGILTTIMCVVIVWKHQNRIQSSAKDVANESLKVSA